MARILDGGIAYLKDGQVRSSYNAADGLGNGAVNDLQLGSDGAVWAATEGGLSRVKDGRVTTLTSRNGLPCDGVNSVIEDDDHSFWLYMPCGLVRIARSELDAWVSDSKRSCPDHGFRQLRRSEESRPCGRPQPIDDQVARWEEYGSHPQTASASSIRGIFPSTSFRRRCTSSKSPPTVNSTMPLASVRLPARVRDLAIDYTALSLVAPEKVHFRFKLEGTGPGLERGGQRAPGAVLESSAAELPLPRNGVQQQRRLERDRRRLGLLDRPGVLSDHLVPLVVASPLFIALLWALYRYRLHQIARELNAQMEGRVDERTARRPRAARYAVAELPWAIVALSGGS